MNIYADVENFRKIYKLAIPDHSILKIKWKLSAIALKNSIKLREELFKLLKEENICLCIKDEVMHLNDITQDYFYNNIVIYKEQNKKLFEFVFKIIFK